MTRSPDSDVSQVLTEETNSSNSSNCFKSIVSRTAISYPCFQTIKASSFFPNADSAFPLRTYAWSRAGSSCSARSQSLTTCLWSSSWE
uniref:Uncharacterized protein n=1 Tax=Arundo donax TaxID=35708 RepID=A0A0A9F0F9_ARUDO